jgi:SAM-dependent methyltransferase
LSGAFGGHSGTLAQPSAGCAYIVVAMPSWYDSWADRYEDLSKPRGGDDVSFYVGLALDTEGPLVELAVGTGRIAIPVAQATGRRVIGIDSSRGMLAQARLRAIEAGVELDLREGDMRELELEEPAALIYCPGRSLLHLPTWADRRRCFERVAASLQPNGRFAWNAFAFDHHIASAVDGQHADPNPAIPLPHTNHYSVSDNRVDVTLDDGGTGSLWWATKNEWRGLIDVAGLRLEALYGGFAKEPLDDDSREYVFVAHL